MDHGIKFQKPGLLDPMALMEEDLFSSGTNIILLGSFGEDFENP